MYPGKQHRALPVAAIVLALSLSGISGAWAADDYLSILEAEAADTGNTGSSAAVPVEPRRNKTLQPGDRLTPGLDFEAFGNELRARYAGTHLLYMKLSVAARRVAWKRYADDNSLSSVRKNIVALMSSG